MASADEEDLIAKYDFCATESHELTVQEGEPLKRLDRPSLWWKVMNSRGEVGYVPSNFVRPARQGILSNLKNTFARRKPNGLATNRKFRRDSKDRLSTFDYTTRSDTSGRLQRATNMVHSSSMSNLADHLTTVIRSPKDGVFYSYNKHKFPEPPESQRVITVQSRPLQSSTTHNLDYSTQPNSPSYSAAKRSESICRVVSPYTANLSDELSITPGQRIRVMQKSADGWWFGQVVSNEFSDMVMGWFPSNLVVMEPPGCISGYPKHEPASAFTASNNLYHANSAQRMYDQLLSSKGHVMTLRQFERTRPEEISFEQHEILQVLERPMGTSAWWLCRNAWGNVGWVPSSHLRLLSLPESSSEPESPDNGLPSPKTFPPTRVRNEATDRSEAIRMRYSLQSVHSQFHGDKVWFWGNIDREECERMLRAYSKPGEFLVRDSRTVPGNLSITVNAGHKNRNFKILLRNGGYHIGWRTFGTMEELIDHYQRHFIYTTQWERCSLTQPFIYPKNAPQLPIATENEPPNRTYEVVLGPKKKPLRTKSI